FAAVDCTGHGVPGAFMSMIGHTILSEIVNENRIFDPARILEMLHEGIVKALKQHESGNTDGMDVCLCHVAPQDDGQRFALTFAGAKRSLYIFQNREISEIKGDRFTVGGTQLVQEVNFENHHLQLSKGDCIYLSTDGFIDTPNPDREKFGSEKIQNPSAHLCQRKYAPAKEIYARRTKIPQKRSRTARRYYAHGYSFLNQKLLQNPSIKF
ncbi:MAG: SpoIIE family protein phosphatase, partial [Saprospiraceae bacterium]|nr:SpoIIE family protein phosphatase [Saprospiraceae bacterium]